MPIYNKYAQLLTNYCLEVTKGDKVLINSTYLAEELLQELLKEISLAGGHPVLDTRIQNYDEIMLKYSNDFQINWINPTKLFWTEHFDCYLNIKSSFENDLTFNISPEKRQMAKDAYKPLNKIYNKRTGDRSLRRNLCLFPTTSSAKKANMSLVDYQNFVFNACKLFSEDPIQEWKNFSIKQQKNVDYMNSKTNYRYKGENVDLTYTTKGRIWINSDGKTNMPSGEIYTAPEDYSLNGRIFFTIPTRYMGKDLEGIELIIKDGYVEKWNAEKGKDFLDEFFQIDGARRFGEAAIGTNYDITIPTNNILFDEKIGGTCHFALGNAYKQCNGVNESSVHWDLITDIKDAKLYADDELFYENGNYIIQ